MSNAEIEFLHAGYSAGNFSNAYETECLTEALEPRFGCGVLYLQAFTVGFYASYEDHEIPPQDRERWLRAKLAVGGMLEEAGIA